MIQWIVSSSLLVCVLIALRYLLRGRIKPKLQYALWALALVRLLLPVQFGSAPISVENAVAQAPLVQEIQQAEQVEYFDYQEDGFAVGYYSPLPDLEQMPDGETEKEPVTEVFTHAEADRLTSLRTAKEYLIYLWVGGMAVMGVVFLISNLVFALRLKKSRILLEKDRLPVYVTEATETPCLFGFFRPAIYLTPAAAEEEHHRVYAIAHETTHFRHGDALWAVLRSLCLVVHWYNPLVWWAAVLSRADGEIACDESTIVALGESQRAEYGRVLIDLTCRKKTDLLRTATTMTGSVKGLKERIKSIAKKPKMAIYTLISVVLVAALAVGCTFTGAKKDPEPTDPTTEATEPTGATQTTGATEPMIEEKLPDEITGTPLTEEELAAFTQMFTHEDETQNWYNVLLACEFSRPVDINLRHLFQNGFRPLVEMTEADEAFLTTLSWYYPNGGDVYKLPASRMEEVLNAYLGVSLANVNRHYLESMHYFAGGDCYFTGGGGAIGAIDFAMIDGKREEDGTVWLMSRNPAKVNPFINNIDELRILCLKPQPDNPIAPYRVESCQMILSFGKPYPQPVDPEDYVIYQYTGSPVTIQGKEVIGYHQENFLYAYSLEYNRRCAQIGYGPVHSFTTGGGHIYLVNMGQSQILRCDYSDNLIVNMQVVYTSGDQINAISYIENGKLLVEEKGATVLLDLTTGEPLRLPTLEQYSVTHNVRGTYFLLRYRADSEIVDFGYEGKPYTTAGMEENCLYAINDGVTVPISGAPVSNWTKDLTNGRVYFVKEGDSRRIWRTDLHGQNPAVAYESQYGDITFLSCVNGWLSIIESDNRAVLFDTNTGKLTVVLEPYRIEQFSYDAEEMRIFWEGKLNESDPEKPGNWYLGDYRYYYYLKTDQYRVLMENNKWVTVTPES